jgi:hypothetical protein
MDQWSNNTEVTMRTVALKLEVIFHQGRDPNFFLRNYKTPGMEQPTTIAQIARPISFFVLEDPTPPGQYLSRKLGPTSFRPSYR